MIPDRKLDLRKRKYTILKVSVEERWERDRTRGYLMRVQGLGIYFFIFLFNFFFFEMIQGLGISILQFANEEIWDRDCILSAFETVRQINRCTLVLKL